MRNSTMISIPEIHIYNSFGEIVFFKLITKHGASAPCIHSEIDHNDNKGGLIFTNM